MLDANWSDWSWGSTRAFADATRARSGSVSVRVDYQGWGALSLAGAQPVSLTSTSRLRMWLYSPSAVSVLVSALEVALQHQPLRGNQKQSLLPNLSPVLRLQKGAADRGTY